MEAVLEVAYRCSSPIMLSHHLETVKQIGDCGYYEFLCNAQMFRSFRLFEGIYNHQKILVAAHFTKDSSHLSDRPKEFIEQVELIHEKMRK